MKLLANFARLIPVAFLLLALFLPPPSALATSPVTQARNLPSAPPPETGFNSVRSRLRDRLAVPDLAVLTLGAGVLLVFVECNLPGAILPGAFGLLLLLSGSYGLAMHALQPVALLMLATSIALILLSSGSHRPLLLGLAGTLCLVGALWKMVEHSASEPGVHLVAAASVGLLVGPAGTILGRIARQARCGKAIDLGASTAHLGTPGI